jgi:hypothetical protein
MEKLTEAIELKNEEIKQKVQRLKESGKNLSLPGVPFILKLVCFRFIFIYSPMNIL